MIGRLERVLHNAARLVAYASGMLVLLAAFVTISEVFLRSVINRPFFGANDLVMYLLTVGVVGFFPLMVDSGHHIKIDTLGKWLGTRGNLLIERFASVVTLLVLSGFVWQFARQGMRHSTYDDVTQMLHLPLAPLWWTAAGIMALATAIQALIVLTGNIHRLPVHETLKEEA